jgi:NitT/TauT family transport system ATP-binding protein
LPEATVGPTLRPKGEIEGTLWPIRRATAQASCLCSSLTRSRCKSSLLKSIAGFPPPVSGSFQLAARPIVRPGADRMMVFREFDQLLPWKTVLGNVMFPLLVNRTMSRTDARIPARALIAKVNLGAFENVYPYMLSGGMKQRVAIARELAWSPRCS